MLLTLLSCKNKIESVSPGSPPEVETVFDELEREALAQYRASDTSLSILPILEVLSPEQETRLQDLEREALEQYDQTCGDDLERAADLQESQETMSPALKRKRETPVEEVKEVELFEEVPEPKKERGKKYSRIRLLSSCSRPADPPPPPEKQPEEAPPPTSEEAPPTPDVPRRQPVKEADPPDSAKRADKKRAQKKVSRSVSKRRLQEACKNEEVKSLIVRLKVRVLNYIRNVDLRLGPENQLDKNKTEKETVKRLLYNGSIPKSLVELVKIPDIADLETLKSYVKEHRLSTKRLLYEVYKRVRVEFIESSKNYEVSVAKLTCKEKRKVRKSIERCLLLSEKAMELRKVGKKAADVLRRDVTATLSLIHQTMEVVYTLRDMTKEVHEEIEAMKPPYYHDPLRVAVGYVREVRKRGYHMDPICAQGRPTCLLKVAFLRYKKNYNIADECFGLERVRAKNDFVVVDSFIFYNCSLAPLFSLSKESALLQMRRCFDLCETVLVIAAHRVHIERYERARYLKSIWPREWWSDVVDGDGAEVAGGLFSDPRTDGLMEHFFDSFLAADKDFLGEQMGEGDVTHPSFHSNPRCSLQ